MKNRFRWALAFVLLLGVAGVSHAAIITHNGALELTDPTYNRPIEGVPPVALSNIGTNVFFDTYTFDVLSAGLVTIRTTAAAFTTGNADDTFLTLYFPTFNPAAALVNALAANDDAPGSSLSLIALSLNPGTYTVVATSFDNGQTGNYTLEIRGDVTDSRVPEPATLLLLIPGIVTLATRRRRK